MLGRYRPSSIEGGHAVCVVGYRADGRFIIRNSWGRGWGDGGFAYATDAWVRAAFLAESYGITV
jgi:C1A family cysteine protease